VHVFEVDLRNERFLKVWRVSNDKLDATAAIVRGRAGYTARFHYSTSQGSCGTWKWPDARRELSEREMVQSAVTFERRFRALAPNGYERIDFPHGSNRSEQMVLLMDYGLAHLLREGATVPDLQDDEDS
jgi:hypothetical protein